MDEEENIWNRFDVTLPKTLNNYSIQISNDGNSWINVYEEENKKLTEENRLLKIKLERLQKLFNLENNEP
jgi:hypothetical protein